MDHRPTPALTHHARERCEEMGISTKIAKRIVQHADMTMPGNKPGLLVAKSDRYPAYRVVYREDTLAIVTVCFESKVPYVRRGTTFEIQEA